MADLDKIKAGDAERARLDHAIQQMSGPGQAARVILNDDRLVLLRELAALRAEAEKLRGVVEAAKVMSQHMINCHELSSCCHDFTPSPAYLLEQALSKLADAGR